MRIIVAIIITCLIMSCSSKPYRYAYVFYSQGQYDTFKTPSEMTVEEVKINDKACGFEQIDDEILIYGTEIKEGDKVEVKYKRHEE